MKVLVTGGSGQLARAIQTTWSGHDLVLAGRDRLDLGCRESIERALAGIRPQVVINAGAFTQVDLCEAQPDLAMRVNGTSVAWLAEGCDRLGARLVQISTDYVFPGDGARPCKEEDPPGPRSWYGRSKLLGEAGALGSGSPGPSPHLVVRTSWLYDAWGRNFLLTMLDLAARGAPLRVVDDQRGTPTSCRALARQLQTAVEEGWTGLVHGTCAGETTWHGFAAEIFRRRGLQVDLSPCATADFPRPAPRPAYSVLDGGRRQRLGTDRMPAWGEALGEVLADL